jgi:transcriptional regulator with XRE-family HTH domain
VIHKVDDFSMKLKELRKEKGLTQKELGAAIGISEVMIGQYERGVRTPKIEMREKIANALGVTLNYFLSDSDYTNEVLAQIIDAGIDKLELENQIFISYLKSIGINVDIQPTSATPGSVKNSNIVEPTVFYRYEVTGDNTPKIFSETEWKELQERITKMIKLLIN